MIALSLSLALAAAPPAPVSVLFAGDVTLGYHYEEYVDAQVAKGGAKDELLAWGFQRVKDVTTKADLFVVNLECPFTERGEKIPKNFNFRARPELSAALAAGGVDVASLANNHLLDYGPEGLFDTLSTLETLGIAHFGAGRTLTAARAPAIVERKGQRFAFLGYFFLGDRNIEPKQVIATADQPGVAGDFSDLAAVKAMVEADVRAARRQADHVIPFFHWGREGATQPEPYQVELAHAAIDAGAAAVVGSHPHVLQGVELYRDRPIAYSLGNFVFGGNWNPRDKRTALLELRFTKSGPPAVAVRPAYSDAYPEVPVQPYLAEGAQAQAVLEHLATISAGFPRTIAPLTLKTPRPTADAGSDAGLE
jgi:poly-gamma-glutamate capsule biosynthesis protein CapA/YwtB (metallophosphatase superfamily)